MSASTACTRHVLRRVPPAPSSGPSSTQCMCSRTSANGCGYCVGACPFGVVEVDKERDGKAHKCTLCYDRLKDGLEPACAKSCPTDSIRFGPVDELLQRATQRVEELRERGVPAYLYG